MHTLCSTTNFNDTPAASMYELNATRISGKSSSHRRRLTLGEMTICRAMNVEDQKDSSDNIIDEQDAKMRQDKDDRSQMQDTETNQSEV